MIQARPSLFWPFSRRATPRQTIDLGMDFHSHLLPEIDDGIANYEDARLAITQMTSLGFRGAILTPHIYKGIFDNRSPQLKASFASFTATLQAEKINFALHLAAEYFADEYFLELIAKDDLLWTPVGRERWVLLEFPYVQETPFAGACLSALVARGYRPVVAHVERYRFVAQNSAKWLAKFAACNAVLQGDIGSLVGQFGEEVQRCAITLLQARKINLWGTDLHNPGQLDKYIRPGLAKLLSSSARTIPGSLNVAFDSLFAEQVA